MNIHANFPFKHAGQSIVVIDVDGTVYENDDCNVEFQTIKDWAKGYDVPEMARVLLVDLKPIAGGSGIKDVTEDVIEWWLDETDIVEWHETRGCPRNIPQDEWDDLVQNEIDEREDHAAMMRNPMAYHFGRNWSGIKGYRS